MKETPHFPAVPAMLKTGTLILTLTLATGCLSHPCDGTECKKTLGFTESPAVRDSAFRKNNPSQAARFKVYVENSGSMNGYVRGNTTFKTALHQLIGQVKADVLEDGKSLSLNYINTEIVPKNETFQQFTRNMSPQTFQAAPGNWVNTDLIEMITKVVDGTKRNELSMFVSDCVFSPQPGDDINKVLGTQRTDMKNLLKNKAKENESFGVLVYRLVSDFHGNYFTKTDAPVPVEGERPYFVWFFGDESILGNVRKSIDGIMSDGKADYVVGVPGYEYVPYMTIKSAHAYHYLNAESGADSLFTFTFKADLSRLPLTDAYLTDKGNYTCGTDKYYIKRIKPTSSQDPKNAGYDYEFTVSLPRGRAYFEIADNTEVVVSLNSMLRGIPDWVTRYDDPTGDDYNDGYNPERLRTFGLKSLIEGIADYYGNKAYVSFKILIN